MQKIPIIILLMTVIVMSPVYALAAYGEPEIGLRIGQWVKYKPYLQVDEGKDFEKWIQPVVSSFKSKFLEEYEVSIDDIAWIKVTVADISGTTVTFDRVVKSNNGVEKELDSKKIDLAEFEPSTFLAMPTNLEFGSKFDGGLFGDIVFSKIDNDPYGFGIKNNLFTAHKIFSQTIRENVVENTLEYDILAKFRYEEKTGMLLESYRDVAITNTNTYDSGWISLEISAIDYSKDLKSDQKQNPALNDRDEILERLSDHFVETSDSRFLITNEHVSITDPKLTMYDIILVRDGTELGVLKLYGDDKISSVVASTLYSIDKKTWGDASDVLQGILIQLTDHDVSPNHKMMLLDNKDAGEYSFSETFDDVKVALGWVETSSAFGTGIFSLEITYLNESSNIQDVSSQTTTQTAKSDELESVDSTNSKGNGCLIATATFGSELAPQVQLLREVRDNILFNTSSGTSFMTGFNALYYSFSPTVADWERQNPAFKEVVKATITPMLSTLSILNHVNVDSESEMLGYGIGIILLNIGMYFVAPAVVIIKLKSRYSK